ncbi:MAG: hypothetical protein SVM86_07810 [Candidatus Cloacimonadota bacterium]|nr:hypothetical protein [Candidatus Cloacimonadota bacterium]
MKETPQEKKIHENMKVGVLSVNGFLGDDERHFHEIIAEDKAALKKLNISCSQIADKLQQITDKAFNSYQDSILLDDKYLVSYRSVRGKTICPFAHPGEYYKGEITLKNLENGRVLVWTPLNIHMIKEHCFFEGEGSKHRLDPLVIKKTLFS